MKTSMTFKMNVIFDDNGWVDFAVSSKTDRQGGVDAVRQDAITRLMLARMTELAAMSITQLVDEVNKL